MDAGDVIAVYAAVVATSALGWQVFTWRHRRGNHVDVELRMAVFPMTNGVVLEGMTITAINRGHQPIRVTSAGLFLQDGSGRTLVNVEQVPGATLPGIVAPGDSGMTYMLSDQLEAIDVYRPVQGFVDLASGGKVKSNPDPLMSRS